MTYIARSKPEADRATFLRPFEENLKVPEGAKTLEEDENKRRTVIRNVVGAVKGTGEGTDRGAFDPCAG